MGRDFTTKQLAARVDPRYIQHPLWHKQWMWGLAWGLTLAGLAWAVGVTAKGGEHLYQPGPISASHKVGTANCASCHATWTRVSDDQCAKCHQKSLHHVNQTFAPRCASCHTEHRPEAALLQLADRSCTQCHGDLAVKHGKPTFAAKVMRFDSDHPEFSHIVKNRKDSTTLKFNHEFHLADKLKDVAPFLKSLGLKGEDLHRTQLKCTDCHQTSDSGRLMSSMTYARSCATCHSLEFDQKFLASKDKGEEVPHADPMTIHRYLQGRYTDYLEAHPEALDGAGTAGGKATSLTLSETTNIKQTPVEYIRNSTESTARRLSKKCDHCHVTKTDPETSEKPPPFFSRFKVSAPGVVKRWYNHARFSHKAHAPWACTACHDGTMTSKTSADVIIPGRQICLTCHTEQKGARSLCVECHTYHDATGVRTNEGSLMFNNLHKERHTP